MGALLFSSFFFLGRESFLDLKQFFSIIKGIGEGRVCCYKKEQKNRYNMRFLVYEFSNFENMYVLY